MSDLTPIGEVVEASTMSFVAQCLEVPRETAPRLYDPPAFGSFVKIMRRPEVGSAIGKEKETNESIEADVEEPDPFAARSASPSKSVKLEAASYGLVWCAGMSSIEPGRRPAALGYEDEDDLRMQQPQIFELLRTHFNGLLIAHSNGTDNGLRRHVPPTPPRIHARVYPCDSTEVRMLTEDLGFLRSILAPFGASLAGIPADELVAASLREARSAQIDDHRFLLRAGRALAAILAEDYERLRAILRNVV